MLDRLNDYLLRQIISRQQAEDTISLMQCTRRLQSAIGLPSESHWPLIQVHKLHLTIFRDVSHQDYKVSMPELHNLSISIEGFAKPIFSETAYLYSENLGYEAEHRDEPKVSIRWFRNGFDNYVRENKSTVGWLGKKTFTFSSDRDATREAYRFLNYLLPRAHISSMDLVNLDKGIVWDMLHLIDEYHSSVEALNIDCISAGPDDEKRLHSLERCLARVYRLYVLSTDFCLSHLGLSIFSNILHLYITVCNLDQWLEFMNVLPSIPIVYIYQSTINRKPDAFQVDSRNANILFESEFERRTEEVEDMLLCQAE
ncbi:hypothetical protein WR25_18300 [Diploscapter pachys]|uniref:Uncharacterized protein n=1 Tax=Diploscapter pachys TaxID=2018661 RepID=A0A2A2LDW6_9BILA|nr:hypothetical protein WR25_18300 [Diploscapter pachys]